MLAFLNIGPMEWLIIGFICLFFLAVPAGVVVLVILLTRNKDRPKGD